jgi:hypothetical protein
MEHLYCIENPAARPAPKPAMVLPPAAAKTLPPSPVVTQVQEAAAKHYPGVSWVRQRGSNRVFITSRGGRGRIVAGRMSLVLGIVLPVGGQRGYVYLSQGADLPPKTVENLPLKKDLDLLFGAEGTTSPQAKNAVRWMLAAP